MALNAKQEAFCQAIATYGQSSGDAYAHAYGAHASSPKARAEVELKGAQLMAKKAIVERLSELKAAAEPEKLWTRDMSIRGLITAYKQGNPAVKVAAIKELNAMEGFTAPDTTGAVHVHRVLADFYTLPDKTPDARPPVIKRLEKPKK